MKKMILFPFWIFLIGLTGCMYIGLLPNELSKHNQKIVEQLPDFSLENYSGHFYSLPEEEDKTIRFSCREGNLEYLITTSDKLYYMNEEIKKTFTIETKEEVVDSEIEENNQEVYEEIESLLFMIHNYDGSYSKASGIRGSDEIEGEILDEVNHYVYDMDWKYSSVAMFVFYVSASNSDLYSFWLRDISNDGGAGKPHFQINFYKDSSAIEDLEISYETMKQNYE